MFSSLMDLISFCVPTKETQQIKHEGINVENLNSDGSKSFASSTQYSRFVRSPNSTQIENQKCPLVKITTNKSYQKSNDCDDLYDVTELNDDFKNNFTISFIEDNNKNKETKSNCFDNKKEKEIINYLNNDSLYNYVDDYDSDFYLKIISKDERNTDNKVFRECNRENSDSEVNSPPDGGKKGDSNNNDDVSNNCGFRDSGENYDRDKFFVRNSEISFDQLKKFRFDYENQSKIKNGAKEIKSMDEKENDLLDDKERRIIELKKAFINRNSSTLFSRKCTFNDTFEKRQSIVLESCLPSVDLKTENPRRLVLKDIEGDALFHKTLVLSSSGLVNGLRDKKDGYSFFGSVNEYKGMIINDFVLNNRSADDPLRLFVIFFERKNNHFYLRNVDDMEKKSLIYVKMTKPFQLHKKELFLIGQTCFNVNPQGEKDITINVFSGELKKNYNFASEDSPIVLGRGKTCKVKIESSFLSKQHTSIEYNDISKSWELKDGLGIKSSLNGTWLLLTAKYELKNDTYVKFGNNIIKIGVE